MTITIAQSTLTETETGPLWAVTLAITDGMDTYALPATAPGSLTEGQLQAHFDAREPQLWMLAQKKAYSATSGPYAGAIAQGDARGWFAGSAGSRQLFALDGAALEAEITGLVTALFPTAVAQDQQRMVILLTSLVYSVRWLVRRERMG